MGAHIRRGVLTLAVAAAVVLGGGFASALDPSPPSPFTAGNGSASTTVDVTYTVISYRAIELSTADPVEFGAVRQGSTTPLPGPDVLYATTWTGDKIEAQINSDTENGIKLYLYAGQITEPNPACPEGGSVGTAAPTVTLSTAPAPFITGIVNCGEAATVTWPTITGGTPTYAANTSAGTWILAKSFFELDAESVANVDASAPVQKTVTFTIKAT